MKSILATILAAAALAPAASAGGVAHEVRPADQVLGTPGGPVVITGRAVKLWSSADADGEQIRSRSRKGVRYAG